MSDDVDTATIEEQPEAEEAVEAPARASWRSRKLLARVVKVSVFVLPMLCSLAWAFLVPALLPVPNSGLEILGWWVLVLGGAIAIAIIAEKLSRRLLPLAVLFRLALAFPEVAPSRFSMALKAGAGRQLKRHMDEDDSRGFDGTPQEAAEELLTLSAALSMHDRLTRGHGERVRAYAVLVGEELELSESEIDRLQWAALLHDIGKLDVAPEVLNKPGRLTSFEWETMVEHPAAGDRYMERLRPWLGEWADAVAQHHEFWDGNGYPSGLSGSEISLAARIVSVADAYDVMTSVRSYKEPMTTQEALAELKDMAGTQFDPEVVRAFLSISTSAIAPPKRRLALFSGVAAAFRFADVRTVAIGTAATAATAVVVAGGATLDPPPPSIAFTEATPTSIAVAEDELLTIDLRTNREVQTYSIDSVSGPATATLDASQLVIEPMKDESGTVTVIVTACGADSCDTTTIVAEVVAVNDPPLAGVDEAEVLGGQRSIRIPVLENDSDADDPDIFVQSAALTSGEGTVRIIEDATELEFLPFPESLGPWTIEYVVTDGIGGFDRGTVTILDGNLEPEAASDDLVAEVLETVRFDPRDNDIDDGGRSGLRIVEVSRADGAEVTYTSSWIEVTAGEDPGEATFSYVVADEMGRSDVGEVTVTITAAPLVVLDDVATTKEDQPITLDVLANDGPPEAQVDPKTLRVLTASSGTVSVGGGMITYEPPADAAGVASILYEVCTRFGECDEGIVSITVESVNDLTTFTADGEIRIPSGAGPQVIPWAAVSSGELTPPGGSSFSISTDGSSLFQVAPAISSDGVLTFTPKPGASGRADTTITAVDPTNGRRVFLIRIIVT